MHGQRILPFHLVGPGWRLTSTQFVPIMQNMLQQQVLDLCLVDGCPISAQVLAGRRSCVFIVPPMFSHFRAYARLHHLVLSG